MGIREPSIGLWVLPLNPDTAVTPQPLETLTVKAIHNVYQTTSKKMLFKFLHQCLFSLPKRTLIKALDNNQLSMWPLNKEVVVKYLPNHSPATDKGSMKRQRKGLRLTQDRNREILKQRLYMIEMEDNFYPPLEREQHNQLFAYVERVDLK